jgi:hypothetical protein
LPRATSARHRFAKNGGLNFKWTFETFVTMRDQTMVAVSKPPLMLQRLSTFVLEVLPWALSSLIGAYLVTAVAAGRPAPADLPALVEHGATLAPGGGVSQAITPEQADFDSRGAAALRTATVHLAARPPIHQPK